MADFSLSDLASSKIRALIKEKKLKPGAHINIDSLSREFGISQTPIREALKKLIAEGMAVYRPRAGYFVRNLSLYEYLQVLEILQVMESYLVKQLAKTPFIVDFEALRRINEELRGEIAGGCSQDVIGDINDKFHKKLYENYHNKLFVGRLCSIWNEMCAGRNVLYTNKVFTNSIVAEHEAIISAIERGDVRAAEEAVSSHYSRGRESAIISFPVEA